MNAKTSTHHSRYMPKAYAKGFDAFLIYGPTASCPYVRADFRRWWELGFNDCRDNKRPRY